MKNKKVSCCAKCGCCFFGALTSVFAVALALATMGYVLMNVETPLKSSHNIPTDLSGYNDPVVTNLLREKIISARKFRSDNAYDLDDQEVIQKIQNDTIQLQNGGSVYFRASDQNEGNHWLIDERGCRGKVEIVSESSTVKGPERLFKMTGAGQGTCSFGLVYAEQWQKTYQEYMGESKIVLTFDVK